MPEKDQLTAILGSVLNASVAVFFALTAYLYRVKNGEETFSLFGFFLSIFICLAVGLIIDCAIMAVNPEISVYWRLVSMGVTGISSNEIFKIIMRKGAKFIIDKNLPMK